MKQSSQFKLMYLSSALYVLVSIFYQLNIRVLSSDELGFSGQSSQEFNQIQYIAWYLWVFYAHNLSPLFLPMLNVSIFLGLLFAIAKKLGSFRFYYLNLAFPTLFYYLNSYLRDALFIHVALIIILRLLERKYFTKFSALLLLRAEFFLIYLCSIFITWLTSSRKKNIIFIILGFVIGALVLSVIIAISSDLDVLIRSLMTRHRPADVNALGILAVSETTEGAVLNLLFAGLFFWLGPAMNFGSLFGPLTVFESFLILLLTINLLFKFLPYLTVNRAFVIVLSLIAFSMLFGAFVPELGGHIRYRVFFIPFLVALSTVNWRSL